MSLKMCFIAFCALKAVFDTLNLHGNCSLKFMKNILLLGLSVFAFINLHVKYSHANSYRNTGATLGLLYGMSDSNDNISPLGGMAIGYLLGSMVEATQWVDGESSQEQSQVSSIRRVDASGMLLSIPGGFPLSDSGQISAYDKTGPMLRLALSLESDFTAEQRYNFIGFLVSKGFLSTSELIGKSGSFSDFTAHNDLVTSNSVETFFNDLNSSEDFLKLPLDQQEIIKLVVIQSEFLNYFVSLFPNDSATIQDLSNSVLRLIRSLDLKTQKPIFGEISWRNYFSKARIEAERKEKTELVASQRKVIEGILSTVDISFMRFESFDGVNAMFDVQNSAPKSCIDLLKLQN